MALLHDNNLTAKDVQEKLGIAGITKVKKAGNASVVKKDRFGTNSYRIDKFIYAAYPDGQEFTTDEMSAELRKEGWQTSEISGQMNGKKKSGVLANRKPTDEEARLEQASQADEVIAESIIDETITSDDDGLGHLE